MTIMKKCSRCKELKLRKEFGKDKSTTDKLIIYCRLCITKTLIENKKYNLKNGISYDGTKKCAGCKEFKPKIEFTKQLTLKDGLNRYCKECTKFITLYKLYKISKKDYNNMLKIQNNKCPVCKIDFIFIKVICVDHDHKNNKVRSLLCYSCNIGLGHFKDNIIILKNAIKYLENN